MWKFILSLIFLTTVHAFNYIEFQRKYCYDDTNIRSTVYYFPYEIGYSKTYPKGYVCENFILTTENLNSIAQTKFVLSEQGTVLLKNCVIEYLNEDLISKFPNLWGLFFENCQLSLKNTEVFNNSIVSTDFNILGFHKCHIFENLNSLALQKFTELMYIIVQNSTFQHPHIDEHFLPRPHNLYDFLMDNVNVKSFRKGFLSTSLHNFDIITCSSCQLDGIDSFFYNMKQQVSSMISFSGNSIKRLPTSLDILAIQNTTEEINLSHNKIEEQLLKRIHFKSLAKLKNLDLSQNKNIRSLSYLTFKDTSLEKLNMSRVNLENLDTLGNANLTTIDFSHNIIKTVQTFVFEDLINLKFLNLSYNKILKLDGAVFQSLRNLRELRLAHNDLKQIPKSLFSGLNVLQSLDLSSNSLSVVDGLENLRFLQELHLQNNHLKIVSSGRSLPSSLRVMDVSNNSLHFIGRNTFSNLDKLTSLDISYTNSYYIDFDQKSFQPLRSLKVLKLKGNKIRSIEEVYLPISLKELDLGYNKISLMSNKGLGELVNLEYLNLAYNHIHEIEKDLMRKLMHIKYIDFSGNDIMYNTFRSMFFSEK